MFSTTYDANSNLRGETIQGPGVGNTTAYTYTYDARDRLIGWQKRVGPTGPPSVASFQYDGADARTSMSFGSATTTYLNDGGVTLEERPTGDIPISYLYAPGSAVPLFRAASAPGEWYHHDASGSVRAVSNSNRATQANYAFDAFGVTTAHGGAQTNQRQFGGQQLDPTALYYTGCGYYDPEVARQIGSCGVGGQAGSAGPLMSASGTGMSAGQANALGKLLIGGGPWTTGGSGCSLTCQYTVTLVQQPIPLVLNGSAPVGTQAQDATRGVLFLLAMGMGNDYARGLVNSGAMDFARQVDESIASPFGQWTLHMGAELLTTALDFSAFGPFKGILESYTGRRFLTNDEVKGWQAALNFLPLVSHIIGELSVTSAAVGRVTQGADDAAALMGRTARVDEQILAAELKADARVGARAMADDAVGASRYADNVAADSRFAAEADGVAARSAGCAANSFSADTPVATADGEKPISTLTVGDHVLAYDEATGTTGSYTVTATIHHTDPLLIRLTLDDETLETTPEHPFFTTERGWVDAGALERGEHVRQVDGTTGVVRGVTVVQRTQPMYNLTVAVAHTFFVGAGRWLVHNAKCTRADAERILGFPPEQSPATSPFFRPNPSYSQNKALHEAVRGKPCWECGTIETDLKMIPDHIEPLVVQHYKYGFIDTESQFSVNAVRPHCGNCSSYQSEEASAFGKFMAKELFGGKRKWLKLFGKK